MRRHYFLLWSLLLNFFFKSSSISTLPQGSPTQKNHFCKSIKEDKLKYHTNRSLHALHCHTCGHLCCVQFFCSAGPGFWGTAAVIRPHGSSEQKRDPWDEKNFLKTWETVDHSFFIRKWSSLLSSSKPWMKQRREVGTQRAPVDHPFTLGSIASAWRAEPVLRIDCFCLALRSCAADRLLPPLFRHNPVIIILCTRRHVESFDETRNDNNNNKKKSFNR